MTCSPCYLANAEDCPRALACLRFFEPNMVYDTADLLLQRPRSSIGISAGSEAQPALKTKSARKAKSKRQQSATEPA
jgi:hypothetical protein